MHMLPFFTSGSYWYWEIILTVRKLFLTAILSVIYPGTVDQIFVCLIITFGFSRLEVACSPYLNQDDDYLAAISNYQIEQLLIIALLLRLNALSGR